MKKVFILLTLISILSAQIPNTEYLYLDILSDLTKDLPNRNPAALTTDNIPYNYAFQYRYHNRGGNYKLPFTPEAKNYQNLEVSAYREMSNGVIFAGRFAYRYEQKKNKFWLHNAETNIDIPFYFADSTIGDFELNGIDWNVLFSYPLKNNVRAGINIFYNVDEQFKTVFPKPNTKRNDVNIQPALYVKGKRSSMGIMGSIFQFKENIETTKDSLEQNRTPIFIRIRGLDLPIITHAVSNEERLQVINGYGVSGHIDLSERLLANMDYENSSAKITDGGSDPIEQGTWNLERIHYRIDLKSASRNAVNSDLYFTQSWSNGQGYHPDFNTLIYQYDLRHFEGGLILPYRPQAGEVFTGTVFYTFQDIKREDNFLGLLHYIPWNTLHVGLDYQLERNGISFGFNVAYEDIKVGQVIEYDEMTNWYYELITTQEIAYYSQDRSVTEAGIAIAFPYRDKNRIVFSGTYQEVKPMNTDASYHTAQTKLEILF